jgi:hypothetical protein
MADQVGYKFPQRVVLGDVVADYCRVTENGWKRENDKWHYH